MRFDTALSIVALLSLTTAAEASGTFNLTSIVPLPGSVWKLNRPMLFSFDAAVDLASVNSNTISILDSSGVPAEGEFSLFNPLIVLFQPRCPLAPDYSDAGLKVGEAYTIEVPDISMGGPTVMSQAGMPLDVGFASNFATPDSDDPAVLFDDLVPGGPTAVVRPLGSTEADATHLQLADDPAQRVYFELDAMGNSVLPPGFLAPLNLYADLETRVAVLVELNQPVSPASANFDVGHLRLEYFEPGRGWVVMATKNTLVRNCEGAGATVKVQPVGILPQERSVRVNLAGSFEDIVGESTGSTQSAFAVFPVSSATDMGGSPVDLGDERLEPFILSGNDDESLEDRTSMLSAPRAEWGDNQLRATNGFLGTGGPNGEFDWHVPPDTNFVLDTTFAQLIGGPDGAPTSVQTVINGIVDVDDLFIPASSTVFIQGPNPLVIWATGEVRIDGMLQLNGGDAASVATLNTPSIPEPGASGTAGGGNGGTGSWRTTTSTERGGSGFGAFGIADAGGEGGESGWSPNNQTNGELRRAAGGGGGVFGGNVLTADGCLDQSVIGVDAESGFPGETTANSAIDPSHMPYGGFQGPSPFSNGDSSDDFWGLMRFRYGTRTEVLIEGELERPYAGEGGGAGGDSTFAVTYPPPNLLNNGEDKGAGGGGGGGSAQVNALGKIVFGPSGRIEANGGHGSGGENTWFLNRVGGGSGGGSGGHVILQSIEGVDFTEVSSGSVALLARGGQGGAGDGNSGGADFEETLPIADAKHIGVRNPSDEDDNPWIPPVPAECQSGVGVVRGAGGDGGPGLIQIHAPDPADIETATGALAELGELCVPVPVGFAPADHPRQTLLDHLVPSFGAKSIGQSKWIAIGEASVAPGTPVRDPIEFLFGGTDPSDATHPGRVLAPGGSVPDLAPVASSPNAVSTVGVLPYITIDGYTLVIDENDFLPGEEFYQRNVGLLREYLLKLDDGGALFMDYQVEAVTQDPIAGTISLTVPTSGPRLLDFIIMGGDKFYTLRPRYFRMVTGGVQDFLPPNTAVQVEFQATPADKLGRPDISRLFPGASSTNGWATDVTDLNAAPNNSSLRYYRFRVTFDLAPNGGAFDPTVSSPGLEFFRLPFRF